VIFVQPPTEFWAGGDRLSGDWRPTMLATGLLVVLLSSPYNPILRGFFGLSPLRSLMDGLIIAGFTLVWIFTLRLVWKWRIVDRYLDVNLADWESSNRE
jgi:cation-transporting ATPase E